MTPTQMAEYLLWTAYKAGFKDGGGYGHRITMQEFRAKFGRHIHDIAAAGDIEKTQRLMEALSQPIFIPLADKAIHAAMGLDLGEEKP